MRAIEYEIWIVVDNPQAECEKRGGGITLPQTHGHRSFLLLPVSQFLRLGEVCFRLVGFTKMAVGKPAHAVTCHRHFGSSRIAAERSAVAFSYCFVDT